jgi:hypothetical protein
MATNNAQKTEMTVAQYLAERIEAQQARGKTLAEIAVQVGYERANVISMLQAGKMPLRLDKVLPMGRALDTDPALMFRLALREYMDVDESDLDVLLGGPLNSNERALLNFVREITGGNVPALTPAHKDALRSALAFAHLEPRTPVDDSHTPCDGRHHF